MCHRREGFWGAAASGTPKGYPRTLNSLLGQLTLSSEQGKAWGVEAATRQRPFLALCCLRLSVVLSYEKVQAELGVQTGRRVSLKTQQRLVPRPTCDRPQSEEPIAAMSLEGGLIRLRTPKGAPSAWRAAKALNLGELEPGLAWFKDNEGLVTDAKALQRAPRVDGRGDGHDGVWTVYHPVGTQPQRRERLDGFHLVENLHKLARAPNRRLAAQAWLWRGEVAATIARFTACQASAARRCRGYLQPHREQMPH